MPMYNVNIVRTTYRSMVIEVEAAGIREAAAKAMEEAPNREFGSGEADYMVDYVSHKDTGVCDFAVMPPSPKKPATHD
jgi:hypothetical protein